MSGEGPNSPCNFTHASVMNDPKDGFLVQSHSLYWPQACQLPGFPSLHMVCRAKHKFLFFLSITMILLTLSRNSKVQQELRRGRQMCVFSLHIKTEIYLRVKLPKFFIFRSSHCGSAVMNLTNIHEDLSLFPGPTQWVMDLMLLWL